MGSVDPRTEKALDTTTIKLHLRRKIIVLGIIEYFFLVLGRETLCTKLWKHRSATSTQSISFSMRLCDWKKSENERKSWKGHWRLWSNDRNLSERWHLRECSVRNLKKSRKLWTLEKHLFEALLAGLNLDEGNIASQDSPELVNWLKHAFKIPESNLLTQTCQNNYFF